MQYDEKTKIGKILEAYPWLEKELPKRYPELKAMDNPASRFMLKRMTVKDASRLSGIPSDTLLRMLQDLVDEHNGK